MILNREQALIVFRKVKQIREEYQQYVQGGRANVLSVQELERIISQMYGIRIVKTQVPFEGEFIRGMMERYADKAVIRIKQNQTDDWKRFTAVKELCHVVIDEKEDWSPQGVSTISDLLTEFSLPNGEEADRVTQSEVLAELAAFELMYPFDCRQADLVQLRTDPPQTTMVKIATYHRMPVNVVAKILSANYHDDVAASLWDEVGFA